MSKAVLTKYSEIVTKENPKITVSSVSPGAMQTDMTAGMNVNFTRSPEDGTVPVFHCLFNKLDGNGWFYGSDAVRSPLHTMRQPGEPAFTGYK